MNYTENYHLPQWEETDRIMRTDFNNAMSSLETGLTACRDTAEAGSAGAKSALYAGFYRMAYNHWHAAAAADVFAGQAGAFRQGFASGEGGTAAGTIQLSDSVWLVNGSETLTKSHITPTLSMGSRISAKPGGTGTTSPSFTPPYAGQVSSVTIRVYCDEFKNATSCVLNCSFEMLVQNKLRGQASGTMTVSKTGATTTAISTSLKIHAGEKHTLRVRVTEINFTGTIEVYDIAVSGYKKPSTSITQTLQSETPGLGGLALVHYEACGAESTLSLQWDGETLGPRATRTVTGYRGKTVQEAEFRLDRAVPASSELKLSIACGGGGDGEGGGDFSLYDWGAILL